MSAGESASRRSGSKGVRPRSAAARSAGEGSAVSRVPGAYTRSAARITKKSAAKNASKSGEKNRAKSGARIAAKKSPRSASKIRSRAETRSNAESGARAARVANAGAKRAWETQADPGMLRAMRAMISELPGDARLETNSELTIKRHQTAVKELLAGDSPHRGLLAYHGLGSGKSCASLVAAKALLEDERRRLVVMMPASLRKGFEIEMGKCGGGIDQSRVSFVSTNGVSPAKIIPGRAIVDGNALHGAIVIVDEVHNLVSQVVNKGVDGAGRGPRLFNALYAARDAKLILLSGTPVVNRPFEVAVLMCLLRGPIHTLVLKDPEGPTSSVTRKLEAHPRVADVSTNGGVVTVLPVQSERHEKAGGKAGAVAERTNADVSFKAGPFRDLGQDLRGMLAPRSVSHKTYDLFPLREAEFESDFVDSDANELKSTIRDDFMSRVSGRVSHYAMSDPEKKALGFPVVKDDEGSVVRLPMTKVQFERYIEQMALESSIAKKLDTAKKRGGVDEGAGVHRTLTRMVCNFAFLKRGQRPFPSTIDSSALKEISGEGSSRRGAGDKNSLYRRAIAAAMALLKKNGSEALREPTLSGVHSPKMGSILSRVRAKDAPLPALVYSQFRSLEGVGIMAAVLEANGFAELRIGVDGAVDPDVPQDRPLFAVFDADKPEVLAAFNGNPAGEARKWFDKRAEIRASSGEAREHERWSPVDVLFITQAGAEGINLRGVRQVHVQEPYWNEVRVQQVVGRAARTKSHDHLPPGQRDVSVYRYLATLTDEQKRNKDILRSSDGGRTADEVLHDLASRKSRLVSTFLDAIASAAVDCGLHQGARVPRERCWTPPRGSAGLRELDIAADVEERLVKGRNEMRRGAAVRVVANPGGKTVRLVYKETGEDLGRLYDAEAFRAEGRLVEVQDDRQEAR